MNRVPIPAILFCLSLLFTMYSVATHRHLLSRVQEKKGRRRSQFYSLYCNKVPQRISKLSFGSPSVHPILYSGNELVLHHPEDRRRKVKHSEAFGHRCPCRGVAERGFFFSGGYEDATGGEDDEEHTSIVAVEEHLCFIRPAAWLPVRATLHDGIDAVQLQPERFVLP